MFLDIKQHYQISKVIVGQFWLIKAFRGQLEDFVLYIQRKLCQFTVIYSGT